MKLRLFTTLSPGIQEEGKTRVSRVSDQQVPKIPPKDTPLAIGKLHEDENHREIT